MNLLNLVHPMYYFYLSIVCAVVVFLVFLLFRKLFKQLVMKLIDRLGEKYAALGEEWNTSLSRPIEYWWMSTGLYVALRLSPFIKELTLNKPVLYIGSDFSLALDKFAVTDLNKLYACFFIFCLTWGCYNSAIIFEKLLMNLAARISFIHNDLLIKFFVQIFRFFTIVIGVAAMVSVFFNLTAIITGVGLGGVAFTFVAKDTLTNILSGIVLMIDKPFVIGDWVQIDTLEGIVEDVSFRSTRIRTFTQGLVVVPNARLSNDNITNWSLMPKRRVSFDLGVTYSTTTTQLEEFIASIKQLLMSHADIEADTFVVGFDQFDDYSLNIKIIYFTSKVSLLEYTQVKECINLGLLTLATEQGIEIAFPTQSILVNNK